MKKIAKGGYSEEFRAILQAYERAGGDPQTLFDRRVASLVISGNRVLGSNGFPGLQIEVEELRDGVSALITVAPEAEIPMPVHLCLGFLPREGVQRILSRFQIGEGAKVRFLAHCSFPNAVRVQHVMESEVRIGERATMEYSEEHFHGLEGGTEVLPRVRVDIAAGGFYRAEFKLVQGAVGTLDVDYFVQLAARAAAELATKVYGKGDDRIQIREALHLSGEYSRGLVKSRIVLQDRAQAEFIGEAVGAGAFARGHIDCTEVLRGTQARAITVPKLTVLDERAKLTHEAAIGRIDVKELETLMARGLSEDEAVEVIIRGLLK